MQSRDPRKLAVAIADRIANGADPHAALVAEWDGVDPAPGPMVDALVHESAQRGRSDPRVALAVAQIACDAAQQHDLSDRSGASLRAVAFGFQRLGRHDEALITFTESSRLFEVAGDELSSTRSRAETIHPSVRMGRLDEAVRIGEECIETFERLGDERGRISVLNALGLLELDRRAPRAALTYFREMNKLIDPEKTPRLAGVHRNNQALCLEQLQRYRAAVRHSDWAREYFEAAKSLFTLGVIDANRAYIAYRRGNYSEAMDLFDRAERTLAPAGATESVTILELDRADMHLDIGMPVEAKRLVQDVFDRIGHASRTDAAARAWFTLAAAELAAGAPRAAIDPLVTALALFELHGNRSWVAECNIVRAQAEILAGNLLTAAEAAEAARRHFELSGDRGRLVSALVIEARIALARGDPAGALAQFDRAQRELGRLPRPWVRVEIFRHRSRCLRNLGRSAEAIEELERAVELIDRFRDDVPADEYMVAYDSSRVTSFVELIELLVDAGRIEQALVISERAHSHALLEMLQGRAGTAIGAGRARSHFNSQRIVRLREQLRVIYGELHRLPAPDRPPLSAAFTERLRERAETRERRLASLLRDAWRRDPEFASLHSVAGTSVESIQAVLDPDTTLIEFFVTPERTFVFLVETNRVMCWSLDVSVSRLERLIRMFQFHLSKFNLGEECWRPQFDLICRQTEANLRELSDVLLRGVAPALRTGRLVVVPHGCLHSVPFHALPFGDGWLSGQFDVRYAPSAGVYAMCAKPAAATGARSSVFAIPDDRAPAITGEAIAVLEGMPAPTTGFVGDGATIERLREHAPASRLLHIASHAMFRPHQPMVSSIRLADHWMNLYDIYGLDIAAEFVVLSACETGCAHVSGSDDALGLVRGFLYAGARRMLVSRWRVHDESAAIFMRAFYGECRSSGDFEAAYRVAMNEVRSTSPHPYFWAPFFLVGFPARSDGRKGLAVADAAKSAQGGKFDGIS